MSRTLIRRLTYLSASAVVLLIVWMLIQDFQGINSKPFGSDAIQNVRSSVNLFKHGIYSSQPISADVTPGYRREPFPNFFLGFCLRIKDILSPGFLDQVGHPFAESFIAFVRQVNLIWAAILFVGIWFTTALVVSPLLAAHWLASVEIFLANKYFVVNEVNRVKTELVVATILVWLGFFLLKAMRSRSWRWFFVAGSVFGLVALTKASAAYVGLVVIPLAAFALSGVRKRFWPFLLAISFGFILTVAPWLVRNQVHFSKPVIAGGGDDVLLIRSVFNQMNARQFGDAFYAYAPEKVRLDLLESWIELSEADFSCDGRLAVFTRDLECDRQALKEQRYGDVLSFYQRGKRAIPLELSLDKSQKMSLALSQFREKPLNALLTVFPIGWRGFWGFRGETWPGIVLNFTAYLSLLLAPVLALIERRRSWLMVSIVPVSLFAFYSLFSHFLPRYSSPFVPVALICLSMLAVDLVERLSKRLSPGSKPIVRLS